MLRQDGIKLGFPRHKCFIDHDFRDRRRRSGLRLDNRCGFFHLFGDRRSSRRLGSLRRDDFQLIRRLAERRRDFGAQACVAVGERCRLHGIVFERRCIRVCFACVQLRREDLERRRRRDRWHILRCRCRLHYRCRRQRRPNDRRLDRPLHGGLVASLQRCIQRGFHPRRIDRRLYRASGPPTFDNFPRRHRRIQRQRRFNRVRSRHIHPRLQSLERWHVVGCARDLRGLRAAAARETDPGKVGPAGGVFRDAAQRLLHTGGWRFFLCRGHRPRVTGRLTCCLRRRDVARMRGGRESLQRRRRAIDGRHRGGRAFGGRRRTARAGRVPRSTRSRVRGRARHGTRRCRGVISWCCTSYLRCLNRRSCSRSTRGARSTRRARSTRNTRNSEARA